MKQGTTLSSEWDLQIASDARIRNYAHLSTLFLLILLLLYVYSPLSSFNGHSPGADRFCPLSASVTNATMLSFLFLIFIFVSSVVSLPNPAAPISRDILPARWFHGEDHPVHDLFRRADPLPVVGSPGEFAYYQPNGSPTHSVPTSLSPYFIYS